MGKLGKRLKRKNLSPLHEDSIDEDIQCTVATLNRLLDDQELFNSKQCRGIRSILHSLYDGKGIGLSGRISAALREGRWNEALYLLKEMRDRKQIPKLYIIQ